MSSIWSRSRQSVLSSPQEVFKWTARLSKRRSGTPPVRSGIAPSLRPTIGEPSAHSW
ncbi:unnamed protein product, partial [Medioppia subpectinata]